MSASETPVFEFFSGNGLSDVTQFEKLRRSFSSLNLARRHPPIPAGSNGFRSLGFTRHAPRDCEILIGSHVVVARRCSSFETIEKRIYLNTRGNLKFKSSEAEPFHRVDLAAVLPSV